MLQSRKFEVGPPEKPHKIGLLHALDLLSLAIDITHSGCPSCDARFAFGKERRAVAPLCCQKTDMTSEAAPSVSESPRKRRKDSNQRAQHFLHTAKLLDTCNAGQKLLFLEHSWTIARALKVITITKLGRRLTAIQSMQKFTYR